MLISTELPFFNTLFLPGKLLVLLALKWILIFFLWEYLIGTKVVLF